jgi:hypothetical protein
MSNPQRPCKGPSPGLLGSDLTKVAFRGGPGFLMVRCFNDECNRTCKLLKQLFHQIPSKPTPRWLVELATILRLGPTGRLKAR